MMISVVSQIFFLAALLTLRPRHACCILWHCRHPHPFKLISWNGSVQTGNLLEQIFTEHKVNTWMLKNEIGQKIEADFTFNVGYYFPLSNEYHIQATLQSR